MIRFLACLTLALGLVACTEDTGLRPPQDLGAFSLGHNVVVASKMKKGPVSRDATEEEWVGVLTAAVQNRFGRYEGDQLYHLGISVEGYMLAPPGVPILYNPRSALILNVTVWDDAAGKKLNDEPHQMTIFEDTTSDSVALGSGHIRSKEDQLQGLADNAMDALEDWLADQQETQGWFDPRPGTVSDTVPDAAETAVSDAPA